MSRVLAIALLLVIFFSWGYPSYANSNYRIDDEKTLPISGGGAIVMDAKNGNILYNFNGEKRFYPASCTKILSSIIAIEKGKLDDEITVSEEAVHNIDKESSHIALDVGEKITLRDALYGMLLASGNDCSVVAAEKISGSVDNFADLMNKKAKEIGCTDSHFTNPHGLFEKNHYTTPLDLARIMRYCISNEEFVEISSTLRYDIPKTNKTDVRELWNNHRMLKNKYVYYEPIVCGKSGYVTKSKFNLVSYGKKDGMELIVVVMKEDDPTSICEDTKALMEHYFNNYKSVSLPASATDIQSVNIKGKDVPVAMAKDIQIILPKGVSKDKVKYKTELLHVDFPIEKGTDLGIVQAVYDGKVLGITPIHAEKTIKALPMTKVLAIVLLILFILLLIIVIMVVIIKRRQQRRRRLTRRQKRRIKRRM